MGIGLRVMVVGSDFGEEDESRAPALGRERDWIVLVGATGIVSN